MFRTLRFYHSFFKFLSTPSARRATPFANLLNSISSISIHALREEGDARGRADRRSGGYFYPRPPRGGRRAKPWADYAKGEFLSTPSARRATVLPSVLFCSAEPFLSTPSARRATKSPPHRPPPIRHFYPRPPRGGRPSPPSLESRSSTFLSTPSARRATMGSKTQFYRAY